jgi:hypothetical protein
MGILDDLNKIVMREDGFEDERPFRKPFLGKDENEDDAGVDDIIKHLDAVKKATEYIDSLVKEQPDNDVAFEAERSLRMAIRRMEDLSKDVYKSNAETEKTGEEE